jgi:hypothetical protein
MSGLVSFHPHISQFNRNGSWQVDDNLKIDAVDFDYRTGNTSPDSELLL